ncbi:MAG: hypothetical protein ACOZF0_12270 [Thermodesulfobacteriota bacterium]
MEMTARIETLIRKGVSIPNPLSVYLDETVDLDRISGNGTIIYPGCKLLGKTTLISERVKLGGEGPATVEDCLLGPGVELKGGYFRKAVFLEKAVVGSGAQVREGTILEEYAGAAHTVGLKQTILFPFATLGSLINFCDCLLAGGTGPKRHSEVGSSFIHFNFTPNQDKATPSLFGDVPRGVMLNQDPIFLGGQGGVVGPCRLAFGTVSAAGTIVRKDEHKPGNLIFGGMGRGGSVPYSGGGFPSIQRTLVNNLIYIANLTALMHWYRQVRSLFISESFSAELWNGLVSTLQMGWEERIKQLQVLRDKVSAALDGFRIPDQEPERKSDQPGDSFLLIRQQRAFVENWTELKEILRNSWDHAENQASSEPFLECVRKGIQCHGRQYLQVIQQLPPEEAAMGVKWLQAVIDRLTDRMAMLLPGFHFSPQPIEHS